LGLELIGNHFPQQAGQARHRLKKTNKKSPEFTRTQGLYLAEKAGFEPAESFTLRTLSRRVT
jgi:hypothetical protein